MEAKEPVDQKRIVFQVSRDFCFPSAVRMKEASFRVTEVRAKEIGCCFGRVPVSLVAQDTESISIGRDHQAVPAGKNLVIAERRTTKVASGQEFGPERSKAFFEGFCCWSKSGSKFDT